MFAIPLELVEHDSRHNKREHAALDHLLDDAEHRHLLLVLSEIEPYARVDQHPERRAHSKVQIVAGCDALIAAQRWR